MTRLSNNGFELNSLTYDLSSYTASPAIVSTVKRTGTYSLRLNDADSGTIAFTQSLEIYLHVAFRHDNITALERFLYFIDGDGTIIASIGMNVSGQLVLYRATGTVLATGVNTVVASQWMSMQVWFKPLNVNGRCQILLDGVSEINFTGDTTSDDENVAAIRLNGITQYSYWDDVVVNDALGVSNNTWPGIIHLDYVIPDGEGDITELTPTGSPANWDNVNERPPSLLDYNAHTAINKEDEYTASDLALTANKTITQVIPQLLAGLDSGAGSIIPRLKSGGVSAGAIAHTLSSAPRLYFDCFLVDPATLAAWTSAAIDAIQIGAKTA